MMNKKERGGRRRRTMPLFSMIPHYFLMMKRNKAKKEIDPCWWFVDYWWRIGIRDRSRPSPCWEWWWMRCRTRTSGSQRNPWQCTGYRKMQWKFIGLKNFLVCYEFPTQILPSILWHDPHCAMNCSFSPGNSDHRGVQDSIPSKHVLNKNNQHFFLSTSNLCFELHCKITKIQILTLQKYNSTGV